MKKKKTIGALVMAGAILVSIPLGVNRSFARLREEVQDEYHFDSTGYAVWEGVITRVETAKNLLTLAEKYEDQDPELDSYTDALEYAADLCENYWVDDIKNVGKQVEYNRRVGDAAHKLADHLETLELSDRDKKYPRQLMATMDSEQDKIERSSFNDKVIEYNQKLTRFPASLLRYPAGVSQISSFGPGSGIQPGAKLTETAD